MNATGPSWRQVNIGSGNGLVPSGDKSLPEPAIWQQAITRISVDQDLRHMASLGPNELRQVTATHLKIAVEFQRLDYITGYQDNSC